ncbi:OmpA family protein [Brumimicrobium aurantiacum]|uniref:Flagellar motor protein MotB n=1 Tax=Brumimicrobium aurantiacum TaxID=1737063 RepID=A0A3E1EZ04_9FLAO|nr:OmpA family protein [Brumimicrobium aurantiacum]RFC54795.1 flagellar motor protein MotB [Brumimicrobium aurantiacum]
MIKNKNLKYLFVGAVFSLASCAPIYKCGEPRPEGGIQGSSRLMDVVEERDDLCETVSIKTEENEFLVKTNQKLEIENDSLSSTNKELKHKYNTTKEDLVSLEKEHMDLSQRYSEAITEKLNQGHLFDERLKEKERHLAMKEEALSEREQEIKALEQEIAKQDSIAERLNRVLREALLGFDSDELTTEIKNGKIYVSMSDKLMFKSGKANVQDKGLEALKALGDVLKKNKEFQILVEGHTDSIPIKTAQYKDNWDLSVARATSMVRILQSEHGLNPDRLTASGRGEFDPRASNETAEGRAKNRRTEIILSPDLSEVMELIEK